MGKALLIAAALALAGCGAASGKAAEQSAPTVAHVGQPAPDWTEPTAPTGNLSFDSLHGHPVYLNFFATWCGPCNEEAPSIESLQEKYGPQGLRVVGIDVLEDAAKAESFKKEYHLSYPAVVDDGKLRDAYRINGLPVHAFIDRNGVIKNIVVGQMSADEIKTNVLSLLK